LKFKEAWQLSKKPYTELTFRSLELTRGMQSFGANTDPVKRVRSVLRGAKISKTVFSIFIGIGSVIPFFAFEANPTPYSLATAVILSLAITLAYSVVYSFQVLPSLSQAAPYSLLLTLPLEERDFSLISLLSFLRTFDYIAVSAVIVQVLCVGLLTGSILASLVMVATSLVNLAFGIALALWLSGVFYKNVTRGGRSKAASVARFIFLLTWGSVVLLFSLLFNFINYLVPYFSSLLAGNLNQSSGVLLAFLHPFSEAIVIASIAFATSTNGIFSTMKPLIYAASAGYVALAVVSARATLRSISTITHGESIKISHQATNNFSIKLRQPIFAYVMKDLRVASKNPQAAFLFALPLFETLIIAFTSRGLSLFGSTSVVAITSIGTFFTLFASSVLLTTEGVGLEYTMTLPLGSRVIIFAKSAVATIAFLPVPVVVLILTTLGSSLQTTALIPFIEILAVSAATTAQLAFFITTQKRNFSQTNSSVRPEGAFKPSGFSVMSGRDVARLGKALIVGAIVLYSPLVGFSVSSLLGNSDALSIVIMTAVAILEVVIVQFLLKRSAYR
jgi:predicted permease